METGEGDGPSGVFSLLISLLIEYLILAVERGERIAGEEDEDRQHEEQYPGSEIEVWFHTDEFRLKWM